MRRSTEANVKANDIQEGGSHYKTKAIQPWDYIVANNIGYLEGNVIKYVSRWKDKAGVGDLKKARHYLDKLIELQGANHAEIIPRETRVSKGVQRTPRTKSPRRRASS